ncbi:pentatricopeptide repeat-containing protein At5g27110-like [Pyrus x bretschneideri]|uniref:pentatricopeptide repeat-containing protein At5g27110-like n=1 Tax=Pyrus x bretschneideri TaxID=225117 RepID=UPI00202E347D|nr:pentatricopeptide repeat-containing protein At5g27110-like [Pyrus x bretschneideri]
MASSSTKNLIDFYFSCCFYDSAKLVFQSSGERSSISQWNGLMIAYTKNFKFNEALDLCGSLLRYPYLCPDCYIYPSVLKACGALGEVALGKMIHNHLIKIRFVSDIVVASSLVCMYAKCNMPFNEMPERDVACWNTVISSYFQDGQAHKAIDLYEKMRNTGFMPNSVTVDLVRLFKVSNQLKMSLKMPKTNAVSWNVMISGYVKVGDYFVALAMSADMKEAGVMPNAITVSSILSACSQLAAL